MRLYVARHSELPPAICSVAGLGFFHLWGYGVLTGRALRAAGWRLRAHEEVIFKRTVSAYIRDRLHKVLMEGW